ncbi:hypothetical protein [Streptomyces sp. NPDC088847]
MPTGSRCARPARAIPLAADYIEHQASGLLSGAVMLYPASLANSAR